MNRPVRTKDSLGLALVPAFLASTCCLSPSALVFLGLSFAEVLTSVNVWVYRGVGLVFLFVMVGVYLWAKGVRTREDFIKNRLDIAIIIISSAVFFALIYSVLVFTVVPVVCDSLGTESLCTIQQ